MESLQAKSGLSVEKHSVVREGVQKGGLQLAQVDPVIFLEARFAYVPCFPPHITVLVVFFCLQVISLVQGGEVALPTLPGPFEIPNMLIKLTRGMGVGFHLFNDLIQRSLLFVNQGFDGSVMDLDKLVSFVFDFVPSGTGVPLLVYEIFVRVISK